MANQLFDALDGAFQAEGRRIAACRAFRGRQIQQRIGTLLQEGQMHQGVHSAYFGGMKFEPPGAFGLDASILVVATPHRKSVIVLDLPGGVLEAMIPSTYLADRVSVRNNELLGRALGHHGVAFEPAILPLKTLAACTGLGAYGRDNVIRVQGMGSYVRLDAWWIDADVGERAWGEPKSVPRCASCGGSCIRACRNECFQDGTFLVDAARCLTFLNEGAGQFPVWLPSGAHSAAIGCLRCQDACPENAEYRASIERRFVFDRQTSQALLCGMSAEALPSEAARLIRLLGLEGQEEKLARNLTALVG